MCYEYAILMKMRIFIDEILQLGQIFLSQLTHSMYLYGLKYFFSDIFND